MSRDGALGALTQQLAARAVRAVVPWGLGFAVVVYTSAATYAKAYPTLADRRALARSLTSNVGLTALFGPARSLDTVAGFAAWRSLGVLTIVGGVWGVLTGPRLLRGEEDAGRWEAVLGGALSRRRAALAGVLAGLAAIAGLVVLTAAGALIAGRSVSLPVSASFFLALALTAPAAVFLGVGVLCGQVLPNRRSAVLAAAAAFGAAYLMRVVAGATSASWLRWLTPIGWTDATHPLTGSAFAPLLALATLFAVLLGASLLLAGRRDLGTGLVVAERRAPRSRRLLGGVDQLAVRQALPTWLGWAAGLTVMCSVLGLVAHSVAATTTSSGAMAKVLGRLGTESGGLRAFLGVTMITVVSCVALVGAGYAASIRETESSGLGETLLVQPVTRGRWLAGRVVAAALGITALGAVIGLVTWLAVRGAPGAITLPTMLAAGLNTVPAALLVLGLGVLAIGVRPRVTAAVAYAVVAWSFLDELVGAVVNAPRWVLDLSLLHHVALAPAADPRWTTNLVLVVLGVGAAVVGTLAFGRRDLAGA
ncbi:MAG: hypothetical protein J0H43_12985 [Actinobacteria bacterium]|nr:hypothetical protein [Actinomycetota bacterium]